MDTHEQQLIWDFRDAAAKLCWACEEIEIRRRTGTSVESVYTVLGAAVQAMNAALEQAQLSCLHVHPNAP